MLLSFRRQMSGQFLLAIWLYLHLIGSVHLLRGMENKANSLLLCGLRFTRMAVRYGTVSICVLRTFSGTVLANRPSFQFLKRTVPTYRTRTITKKAYRISVPYFLAKIKEYRRGN